VDYHELDIMALRARSETEAFININFQNYRKKWPLICRSQIFMENTSKNPCLGQINYKHMSERNDYNFDTQILDAIS
jgi:hypothetical protein